MPLDLQPLAGREHEHLRPEGLGQPPFARLIVAGHELAGAAVDVAAAGDAQALGAVGGDHRRAAILRRVVGDHEFGIVGQVEIDIALQLQRADQVLLPAAHQHLRALAGGRGLIDRALDRRRVERCAVALRAVIAHVEDLDLGAARAGQQKRGRQTKRRAAREHMFHRVCQTATIHGINL